MQFVRGGGAKNNTQTDFCIRAVDMHQMCPLSNVPPDGRMNPARKVLYSFFFGGPKTNAEEKNVSPIRITNPVFG